MATRAKIDVTRRQVGSTVSGSTCGDRDVVRSASLSGPCDLRFLADEDLMHLACDGEPRAVEAIFDRHAGVAFSLAFRICGRRAMAEDVVREAFLSLWRDATRYDAARGSVRLWVLSVVRNRAIDSLRRTPVGDSREALEEAVAEPIAAPGLTETVVPLRCDLRKVRDALEELPPEQRRVIELAYFGGLTECQIAQMLELPAVTVKSRARLGLHNLLAVLKPASSASRMSADRDLVANPQRYVG
jgi:RNA polymerase sigma-70 factor (ECF subfamily)